MANRVTGFPPGSILDGLVQTADSMKEMGKAVQKATVNDPLRAARDELAALSEAQSQALQDAVKASGIATKFSFASSVSGVVSSLSTIASGVYLYREGNELGKQFILTGVIQLVNTAVSSEGFWVPVARVASLGNRTVEQILAPALPFVVTLLTSAWNGRIMLQLSKNLSGNHEKMIKQIEQITSIFDICVTLGNVLAKLNQGMADRALIDIEDKMGVVNAQVSQLLRQREYAADAAKRIESGLKEIVRNQIDRTSSYAQI